MEIKKTYVLHAGNELWNWISSYCLIPLIYNSTVLPFQHCLHNFTSNSKVLYLQGIHMIRKKRSQESELECSNIWVHYVRCTTKVIGLAFMYIPDLDIKYVLLLSVTYHSCLCLVSCHSLFTIVGPLLRLRLMTYLFQPPNFFSWMLQ